MKLTKEEIEKYIKMAQDESKKAYAPYSDFHVGAVLLFSDKTVKTGFNVEVSSTPAGTCAERVAMGSAIAEGKNDFEAIFVSSIDALKPLSPCGICRQFMSEFVGPDFKVYYSDKNLNIVEKSISELLPDMPFEKGKLK